MRRLGDEDLRAGAKLDDARASVEMFMFRDLRPLLVLGLSFLHHLDNGLLLGDLARFDVVVALHAAQFTFAFFDVFFGAFDEILDAIAGSSAFREIDKLFKEAAMFLEYRMRDNEILTFFAVVVDNAHRESHLERERVTREREREKDEEMRETKG